MKVPTRCTRRLLAAATERERLFKAKERRKNVAAHAAKIVELAWKKMVDTDKHSVSIDEFCFDAHLWEELGKSDVKAAITARGMDMSVVRGFGVTSYLFTIIN